MNNLSKFTRSKFRVTYTYKTRDYDQWWDPKATKTVKEFAMTSTYKLYIVKKQYWRMIDELRSIKNKLQFEYEKFGEVNDIDYSLYLYKAQQLDEFKKTHARSLTSFLAEENNIITLKEDF